MSAPARTGHEKPPPKWGFYLARQVGVEPTTVRLTGGRYLIPIHPGTFRHGLNSPSGTCFFHCRRVGLWLPVPAYALSSRIGWARVGHKRVSRKQNIRNLGGRTKEHLKATFEDFIKQSKKLRVLYETHLGQELLHAVGHTVKPSLHDEIHMMAVVLYAAGRAVNTAVSAADI